MGTSQDQEEFHSDIDAKTYNRNKMITKLLNNRKFVVVLILLLVGTTTGVTFAYTGQRRSRARTSKTTTVIPTPAPAPTKSDQALVFNATRSISNCAVAENSIVGSTNHNIFSMPLTATNDCDVKALTKSTTTENWWPRVSHDATRILYYQTPKGVYEGSPGAYSQTSLRMMNIDGTGDKEIIPKGKYFIAQGHAEWSPDDKSIVMFGGDPTPSATNLYGYQIYLTDSSGENLRQVTERIVHGGSDPSWSPDGKTIVFASCPDEHVGDCTGKDAEIVTVAASAIKSKTVQRVTDNTTEDADPYFSPDGKTIAWISLTGTSPLKFGIYQTNYTSGTSIGTKVIDDGNINSKVDWSADGKTLYFHRYVYNSSPAVFKIYTIGVDGTNLTPVKTFWKSNFNGNYDFPSLIIK